MYTTSKTLTLILITSLTTQRMHLKLCLAVFLCLMTKAKNSVSTESEGMH